MSLTKQFNTRPLYQQVADEFISRIVSKQWAPGQPIENETEIARSLGISLGTVRKAFDILSEHKLLERHQGRGTIVSDFEAGPTRTRFSNVSDVAGRRVIGEVSIHDVSLDLPNSKIAESMGVNVRTPLVRFERRRFHMGRCFMVEDVYLRVNAFAQAVSQAELETIATNRWSGQDLATRMVEEVHSAPVTNKDLEHFDTTRITALLTLKRIVFSYQDRPLELRYGRCNLGPDLVYRTS